MIETTHLFGRGLCALVAVGAVAVLSPCPLMAGESTPLSPAAPSSEAGSSAGIVLVAFGTSQPEALKAYDGIEARFASAPGSTPFSWAFTSDIIRVKMAKQGKKIPAIEQALDELAQKGVKRAVVQSLHIAPGEEFSQMERTVLRDILAKPGRFSEVMIGRPLLESEKDMNEVVDVLIGGLPAERKPGEAVVFMGHGQSEGRADLVFSAVRDEFSRRDPLIYLATVEGSHSFDVVLDELKKKGVKKVWLQPFLIVAGDHAKNDLAGSEDDSWASRVKAAGMEAAPILKGMGEIRGIQDIFYRHAQESRDDLLKTKHKKD